MPPITPALLAAAVGCSQALATTWAKSIADACRLAEINSPPRFVPEVVEFGTKAPHA